ncbi:MAG: peptidase M28, partial [Rhodothermales bacterium]
MRTLLLLPLLLLTLAACDTPQNSGTDAEATTVDPENPPEVLLAALDSATARAHLEILSSDAMEGRGTGQPGEERAVAYIAGQMEAAGLEPAGDDGSFFQAVPLLGSTPTPKGPLTFTHENGETLALAFVEDFIASTDLEDTAVSTTGELVFVGYGIDAPGYTWHSFKDVDVAGKIIVSFVNDPLATDEEPDLFQAETLTYFGRWTYKY